MKKLCDICDFQGGSQPPKNEWTFEPQVGYVRMLQIRDFTQSEKVVPEYIKISGSTKQCTEDDILIARYGASMGKILTGLAGAYNVAIMKTIPDTNVSGYKAMCLIIPPIELQNQFAAFVRQVDKLKFETQKSLKETQTLMDSLMQEYFG